MKLILDIETTRQKNPITGKDDPSPYNPLNKLVYVGLYPDDSSTPYGFFFDHKDNPEDTVLVHKKLQEILNKAEVIIGHNLKFDMSWLYECGFHYSGPLYDTMIFEYVSCKGMKQPLSLKAIAERYNLPAKLDILQDYWEKGVNTDAVPMPELEEYALQDIKVTYELYKLQQSKSDADTVYMYPAIQLSNEVLPVIIEMERNGCFVDNKALCNVEEEYINELNGLTRGIQNKINELMGDTPINLDSPDDMSMLLYGIEVKDKKVWADRFGIGTSERNSVKKRKYPKRIAPVAFKKMIKELSDKVFKTEAEQCPVCHGHKKIRKIKTDGTLYKKDNICSNCGGNGFLYNTTKKPAGLGLKPISSQYATAAGFAADKRVIELYLKQSIDEETKAFLRALQRQSAINTYLGTFVEGIKNNVKAYKEGLLLHTSLNQCITATGRLSSSNPNFQNLPRGNTFPVRKAIRSRFEGGKILEVDFAGLEYRVAVMLANCPVGLASILSGKDRHEITANIIYDTFKDKVEPNIWKQVRQSAKAHTFKPLYGGESGTDSEQRYYKAFLEEHTGIAKWHEQLCNEALENKQIKTPTGRIFAFPNVYRQTTGKVTGKTQIVNYPVQCVATADIIWIVVVDIYKEMKKRRLLSKLILQVHDAVIADVNPMEVEVMIEIFKKSFDKVHELLYSRYRFETNVPIGYEMSIGNNWNDKEVINA